jgi:hypothetical protein
LKAVIYLNNSFKTKNLVRHGRGFFLESYYLKIESGKRYYFFASVFAAGVAAGVAAVVAAGVASSTTAER